MQLLIGSGGEQLAVCLDEQGNTALHVAAFNAEDTVAKILVNEFPGLLHIRNQKGRFGERHSFFMNLILYEEICARPFRHRVAGEMWTGGVARWKRITEAVPIGSSERRRVQEFCKHEQSDKVESELSRGSPRALKCDQIRCSTDIVLSFANWQNENRKIFPKQISTNRICVRKDLLTLAAMGRWKEIAAMFSTERAFSDLAQVDEEGCNALHM